jgi:heme/copper-type cytochrome/quinol oxidase subunit 2
MKKLILILGIVIVLIVAIIAIWFIWSSNRPAVPDDYTENVKTGGQIEAK